MENKDIKEVESNEKQSSPSKRGNSIKKTKESILYAVFLFTGLLTFWAIARKTIMPFVDNELIPHLRIKAFYLLSDTLLINIFLVIVFVITTLVISFFLAKYIYDRAKSFPCSTLALGSAYYLIYGYEWWQHKVGLPWQQWFDWIDIFNLTLLCFIIGTLYKLLVKLKDFIYNNKDEYYVKHNLKSDEPIENKQDDRLNYQVLAQDLAKQLNNARPFQSISIAINGAWGVGKTSFVKLLKKELDRIMEDEHKHIVLEFNPRLSKSKETIQEDFFALLFSELARYNSSFYTIGASYLKTIDVASQSFWWLGFLSFFKTGNRNREWLKINEAVRKTNKQIFIFIDDLDRLVGEEILEVFKIIGGNANFDNITFIVAFDKDYVHLNLNKIITNTDDSRGYPEKFFTGEYHLNRLSRSQIESLFIEFFVKDKYDTKKGDRICSQVFSGISEEVLVKYFKTIRDIKRFITFVELELSPQSLKRMLSILVPRKVFLMFLLKFKASPTYDSLYDMEYFSVLNNYPLDRFILRANLNKESILCYDILKELFEEEELNEGNNPRNLNNPAKSPYSISNNDSRWFYSYFITRDKKSKYHIDNRVGVPDIEDLLQDENYKSMLDALISKDEKGTELPKDKQDKLLDIVDFLSIKENRIQWQKNYSKSYSYLLIFLHNIFGDYTFIDFLDEILIDDVNNINDDYKEFFKQTLIALNHRGSGESIFRRIIIGSINKQWQGFTKIANQGEFLDWAKTSIIDRLKQDKIYIHQKHYKMLIACVKEKNINGEYLLDEKVCQIVKDIVIQAPEDFANNLIVLGALKLQFMPYFNDVFGGEDQLIEYFKKMYNGRLRTRILNFITLYEANQNKHIHIGSNDKIDKLRSRIRDLKYDFNQEIKVLKRGNEIKQMFENGKLQTYEELNNHSEELVQMMRKIELPIIWETLRSIEKEMNHLRESFQ